MTMMLFRTEMSGCKLTKIGRSRQNTIRLKNNAETNIHLKKDTRKTDMLQK